MSTNFINLSLGDNDFGYELEEAGRHVTSYMEVLSLNQPFSSERALKEAVVTIVVGLCELRSVCRGFATEPSRHRAYLERSLKVEYLSHAPQVDHDGGSVCIDVNRRWLWRY